MLHIFRPRILLFLFDGIHFSPKIIYLLFFIVLLIP